MSDPVSSLRSQPAELDRKPERSTLSEPDARDRVLADGGAILARVAAALPEPEREALRRLVGHSLAAPSASVVRQVRLGLLMEMVACGTGEVPRVADYEQLRSTRSQQGEQFPAHSTLIEHFGSWTAVVAAAMAQEVDRGPRMVFTSLKSQREHHPRYRRRDVRRAIRACAEVLGAWPNELVYYDFVTVERDLRRRAGTSGSVRLPSQPVIKRLYGSFATALSAARREAGVAEDDHAAVHANDAAIAGLASVEGARRSTSELVLLLWGLVRSRDRIDRMSMYRALVGKRSFKGSVRVQLGLNALWSCAREHDGSPSWRQYEHWRDDQANPTEWPSVKSIRLTFGSWARALAACGFDPAPDLLAHQLTGMGGAFSRDELIGCIRDCAAVLGRDYFAFRVYKRWAHAEMRKPEEQRCRKRVALAHVTFCKYFGSWPRARLAAALSGFSLAQQNLLLKTRGLTVEYSEEALLGYIRRAARATGRGALLSPNRYDRWAKECRLQALTDGRHEAFAASYTIRQKFRGWPEAMYAAGLLTGDEFQRRRQGRAEPWSDDEILQTVARAYEKRNYSGADPAFVGGEEA